MTPAPIGVHAVVTSYPSYCFRQDEVMAEAARVFGHRPELMQRLGASYGNAGVRQRQSCVPLDWYASPHGWAERMRLFEENAVRLLSDAANRALASAGITGADVAATVAVSSTGIVTPSLDTLLMEPLGLPATLQRLPVFGLGCAGGVIGLSRAAALARAQPGQWVLLLCVELCGLTFRPGDDSKANIIGTTIFGDGAAAVLLRCQDDPSARPPIAQVRAWGEHTWPRSRDVMGWQIEDDGFGVVFSQTIPALVRDKIRGVTDAFLYKQGLTQADLAGLIAHPGGAKVLAALEEAYGLDAAALEDSRAVLADHGNMSAITVLAVLERVLARGAKGLHLMTALGPGFSVGMSLVDLAP